MQQCDGNTDLLRHLRGLTIEGHEGGRGISSEQTEMGIGDLCTRMRDFPEQLMRISKTDSVGEKCVPTERAHAMQK